MNTNISKYSNRNKQAVIDLLRSNTPAYFDDSEENDFVHYLENEVEDYFIVEEDSKIIGAGGINYFPLEKTARISWDMISPKIQGRGVGRRLLEHRIKKIEENSSIDNIVVRTSQHAYLFYEKSGFVIIKIEKDYWAKGFDLYIMTMKIKL